MGDRDDMIENGAGGRERERERDEGTGRRGEEGKEGRKEGRENGKKGIEEEWFLGLRKREGYNITNELGKE